MPLAAQREALVADLAGGCARTFGGPHCILQAGQTVPHVHIHLLPRKQGDFGGHNDAVYDEARVIFSMQMLLATPCRSDDHVSERSTRPRTASPS